MSVLSFIIDVYIYDWQVPPSAVNGAKYRRRGRDIGPCGAKTLRRDGAHWLILTYWLFSAFLKTGKNVLICSHQDQISNLRCVFNKYTTFKFFFLFAVNVVVAVVCPTQICWLMQLILNMCIYIYMYNYLLSISASLVDINLNKESASTLTSLTLFITTYLWG